MQSGITYAVTSGSTRHNQNNQDYQVLQTETQNSKMTQHSNDIQKLKYMMKELMDKIWVLC